MTTTTESTATNIYANGYGTWRANVTTPLPASIDDYRDADRAAQLAALAAIRGALADRQPPGWDPAVMDVTRESRTIDHERGTIETTWRERLAPWVYAERLADIIPDVIDPGAWDGSDIWGSAMEYGFAACDLLTIREEGHRIPAALAYSPGAGGHQFDADDYMHSVLELVDTHDLTASLEPLHALLEEMKHDDYDY